MNKQQNGTIDTLKTMKFHKISPCRYCGRKPKVFTDTFKFGYYQKYKHAQMIIRIRYGIECTYCGAYVTAYAPIQYADNLYKELIRKWNEMNCNWKKGL